VRKKYLLLLLVALAMALGGCPCDKKHVAPPPELEAPSDLTATAINYNQINLSWKDNSDIEDGFRVCCDMGEEQYQTVDTLPANTISFEHYKLQPLTKYSYYIQAYWGEEYANSKEVSVVTPDPIEFIDSLTYFTPWGNTGLILNVAVKNWAFERCKVELRATFYNEAGIEYSSWTETPILAAGEVRNVQFCTYKHGFPVVIEPLPTYTIEIIKAEILY